jgi:hypothetical protein
MNINVLNDVPVFSSALVTQYVSVGHSHSYTIVDIDPEGFSNTVSVTGMPGFMSFLANIFTISPLFSEKNGTIYPVIVSLSDGAMISTSTFNVIIINLPPAFVPLIINQTVFIGNTITY